MDRAAIAWINLADSGAWSVVSGGAALSIANLQDVHVQNRYRSTANLAALVCDLGSSKPIDTLALFGTTMAAGTPGGTFDSIVVTFDSIVVTFDSPTPSAGGTARVRVSTADATGAAGDAYDSVTPVAVDAKYNAYVVALASPVTGRYVRFDLSDASASYVEAGRAFIGLRTQFTYSFGYGWQKGRVDRSLKTKTRGGQTQVWRDNAYRTVDVTFSWVTPAQRDSVVEAIDIANGASTDILFMIDPTSSNLARDSIWGLITDITPVTQNFFDLYEKQYKIEERM